MCKQSKPGPSLRESAAWGRSYLGCRQNSYFELICYSLHALDPHYTVEPLDPIKRDKVILKLNTPWVSMVLLVPLSSSTSGFSGNINFLEAEAPIIKG